MTNLADYSEKKSIKMLLIGDSGKGKTGALASLAAAGKKLRILDFDNGLPILASVLKKMIAEGKAKPEALTNVIFESCLDDFITVGGKILPKGTPTAFTKGMNMLTKWKGKDGVDLGNVGSWEKDTVLVIDSLSHLSNAAMVYILAINNRSGEQPYQSDWGQAQEMIEGILKILYSDAIKCHVIVCAHITYVGGTLNEKTNQMENQKPHPNSLGQKLPPKIATYFNTMLQVDTIGLGAATKRIIRTYPNSELALKSEILGLPKELPLESGLADFFRAAGQL